MGEDFAGQKRQQDMFQYSMASSLVAALISGWFFQSMKTAWYTYLVGLFFTWLINIVQWSYLFPEPTSWAEGRYLDASGFWELEKMAAMNIQASSSSSSSSSSSLSPKLQQRAQITLSGGPARMTISSRLPSPLLRFKKWVHDSSVWLHQCKTMKTRDYITLATHLVGPQHGDESAPLGIQDLAFNGMW